jgi:hypothetical protein
MEGATQAAGDFRIGCRAHQANFGARPGFVQGLKFERGDF